MTGIFPGSFDPPTVGHMDLIRRASAIFDRLTVAVMVNRAKDGAIPREERVRILRKACAGMDNVDVEMWEGLLADYVRQHPGSVVVRGVRDASEYDREACAAAVNRKLNPDMETLLLPASDGTACVSSSAVREIASFGGDYSALIPRAVRKDIDRYLKK